MKKKRFAPLLISFFLFLAGTLIIAYPHISQKQYKQNVHLLIENFDRKTAGLSESSLLYEKIRQYNQTLFEESQAGLTDPFSYEQVDFSLMEYGFEEEIIGYLSIPQMQVELPVYLGASLENLNRGAAHLSQTSIPIGGNNHNAVIAAHRDMGTALMFQHIEKLKPGDRIQFTNFRETLSYQVIETLVIQPNEIDKIMIQPGRDLFTLITCHPYGRNTQRYIVYCQRI